MDEGAQKMSESATFCAYNSETTRAAWKTF